MPPRSNRARTADLCELARVAELFERALRDEIREKCYARIRELNDELEPELGMFDDV